MSWTCTDITITGGKTIDAGGDPAAAWRAKMLASDKALIPVARGCSAQFADRESLATCDVTKTKGDVTVSILSSRYDFADVGLSDGAMKECLGMGGDWRAISRDSSEWRTAKLEYSQRKLRKLSDQLGR